MTAIDIALVRGRLRFARADFEAVFGEAAAVILLRDVDDLLVLPLHEAALGGFLVKRRNAAGDRVVDALDFFRAHELEDERVVAARWDPDRGGLRAAGLFAGPADGKPSLRSAD